MNTAWRTWSLGLGEPRELKASFMPSITMYIYNATGTDPPSNSRILVRNSENSWTTLEVQSFLLYRVTIDEHSCYDCFTSKENGTAHCNNI